MSKPLATAIIIDRGRREVVPVIKSKAAGCVASFYAPGWRAMGFSTVERAFAKISRHPGFQGWEQAPQVAQ